MGACASISAFLNLLAQVAVKVATHINTAISLTIAPNFNIDVSIVTQIAINILPNAVPVVLGFLAFLAWLALLATPQTHQQVYALVATAAPAAGSVLLYAALFVAVLVFIALLARTSSAAAPIGSVVAYMSLANPPGWLEADGRALYAHDYPQLYSALVHQYGDGGGLGPGGRVRFSLPDLRGHFLRGLDTTAAVDIDVGARTRPIPSATAIGAQVGSRQASANLDHQHPVTPGESIRAYHGPATNWRAGYQPLWLANDNLDGRSKGWTVDSLGPQINTAGAGGHESRPVNTAVRYLIRAY